MIVEILNSLVNMLSRQLSKIVSAFDRPIYKYYLPFFPTPTYKFNLEEYENNVLNDVEIAEKSGNPITNYDTDRIINCLTRIEER